VNKNIIIFSLFLMLCVSIYAQSDTASSGFNTGSVYLYSGTLTGTEQLKIKTYIWGQVRKPGLYIVPDNTDLLTLISSAGGPTENANLKKVRIIRNNGDDEKIIFVNLTEYIENGDEELIPILQPGDTVILSGSTYYAFTKAVAWISQIAIILSVYVSVINLSN
jgi:SLBB domain-containing protein